MWRCRYELDGERSVWPQLQVIKSLCEIEMELSRVSSHLTEELAAERAEERVLRMGSLPSPASASGTDLHTKMLDAMRHRGHRRSNSGAAEHELMLPGRALGGGGGFKSAASAVASDENFASGEIGKRMQSTSSFASLLSLGAV